MTHQCALNVPSAAGHLIKSVGQENVYQHLLVVFVGRDQYIIAYYFRYLRRPVFTFIFLAKTTDMWSSLQDLPLSQTNPEARTDLDCVSVWSTSLSQMCAVIAKRNHVTGDVLREPTSFCLQATAYFSVIEYLYE